MSSRPGSRQLNTERRGRLGDLGQDYEQGHRTYVEQLDPGARLWLRTKPFGAPPNQELAQCLRTFRNLTQLLVAEDASWHDVVRTTCYLRDIERDYGEFNAIRTTFMRASRRGRWHAIPAG